MKIMGNRVTLKECLGCGAKWVFARHGREAQRPVGVQWLAGEQEWYRQYDRDDGRALHHWHRDALARLAGVPKGTLPCGRDTCRHAEGSQLSEAGA